MAGMPLWNASMAETRLFGARRPVWTRCMASFCKVLQPRLDKMFWVACMPLWNASMAETRLFGNAAAGMDAPHGGLLQSITTPAR